MAGPPYPGVSHIDIERIAQKKLKSGEVELTVYVSWDHEGPPPHGLPAWVQVRIQDATGRPVFSDSTEQFVVPKHFDLDAQKATLVRRIAYKAGKYDVMVDPAYPDMLASEPRQIEVK